MRNTIKYHFLHCPSNVVSKSKSLDINSSSRYLSLIMKIKLSYFYFFCIILILTGDNVNSHRSPHEVAVQSKIAWLITDQQSWHRRSSLTKLDSVSWFIRCLSPARFKFLSEQTVKHKIRNVQRDLYVIWYVFIRKKSAVQSN